jgi:hypothetical protein
MRTPKRKANEQYQNGSTAHSPQLPPTPKQIRQTELRPTLDPKARLGKWLLLPLGVCAAIVVKAAVLASQILEIVNNIYDSFIIG